MSQRLAIEALAQALARAVGSRGHAPAQEAAARYVTSMARQRGTDDQILARRDRAAPHWGDGLTVSQQLYCAELTTALCAFLPLLTRLDGHREPLEKTLRWACDPTALSARTGMPDLLPHGLLSWLTRPPGDVAKALLAALKNTPVPEDPCHDAAQDHLALLLPAVIRHDLGIHFTPNWAARETLRLAVDKATGGIMDPACGTGVFLLEALRHRWQLAGRPTGNAVWDLAAGIAGVETSPLSACVARCALLRAAHTLAGTPPEKSGLERIPRVHAADVLCDLRRHENGALVLGDSAIPLEPSEVVVGNPPWVAWDALPAGYKNRLAQGPLKTYVAFDLKGFEAQLGKANDDVSVLFTLVVLDRLVSPGGRLAFLLKLNLLTNESSRMFRRFRVTRQAEGGRSVPFAVEHLCDLRSCNPFAAAVEPALLLMRRDQHMGESIPSSRWRRQGEQIETSSGPPYTPVTTGANRLEGPWAPSSAARTRTASLAGVLPYPIRHGLKHDCNGVFLVEPTGDPTARSDRSTQVMLKNRPETARRINVPPWSGPLERRFLVPLIQSRHIRPLTLTGWAYALVPTTADGQLEETELRRLAPATWAYLDRFREFLAARRSRVFSAPPFYRVFGLGPYNWAPALVVWCGMGLRPWFTVVDLVDDPILGLVRPVPDSSCYLIPTPSIAEAHYLAGLLNSTPVRDFLVSRSSGSKRGLSRAVVNRLGLPAYDAKRASHNALAEAAAALARIDAEPPEPRILAEALDAPARRILFS